jgi:hypothetical protein
MERNSNAVRRCSVYTRKSSEEGLEQDFNSLHAQREACEAFIKSQQGEGWRLVESAYSTPGIRALILQYRFGRSRIASRRSVSTCRC